MQSVVRNAANRLFILAVCAAAAAPALGARIEAQPGKVYNLSKVNGPWVIMVATLHGDPPPDLESPLTAAELEQRKKNAEKAAQDLVLELRRKGIPAYLYRQEGNLERINSFDRYGNPAERFVAARRDRVSVLAGNYPSVEDDVAQKTLAYIKNYDPKALVGGLYAKTPGRPKPLSRAFLTVNPLLSPEELSASAQRRDPLLLKLNSEGDHNLSDNKAKYSLVVGSFYGRSQTHLLNRGQSLDPDRVKKFDDKIRTQASLYEAGWEAWQLTKAMRAQGIEAYVFHERFRSIVTVGGFDSPQDPRIRELMQKFAAKMKRDPQSGREVLVCETIQIKNNPQDLNEMPIRQWIMDPEPQLIEVPRLR